MCQTDNELTYGDLNPQFLFMWKGQRTEDEADYHCHDHLELAVILSGEGKYHINGKLLTVKAGDVLVLNPGVYHQAFVSTASNPTVEFFIGFTNVHFKGMPFNHIILKDNNCIMHTDSKLKQDLFKLCYAMNSENTIYQAGCYFMQKAYLIQILLLIMRQLLEPCSIQQGYSFESTNHAYIVEQIIQYFGEHYEQKISLDQIAKNMYLSPFYISKVFKAETGETPINYLIKIRMDNAKQMLLSKKKESIQSVARAVGYDDAYYFSKLFKKHFGVAPSKIS